MFIGLQSLMALSHGSRRLGFQRNGSLRNLLHWFPLHNFLRVRFRFARFHREESGKKQKLRNMTFNPAKDVPVKISENINSKVKDQINSQREGGR
jgi:hypothetical protein